MLGVGIDALGDLPQLAAKGRHSPVGQRVPDRFVHLAQVVLVGVLLILLAFQDVSRSLPPGLERAFVRQHGLDGEAAAAQQAGDKGQIVRPFLHISYQVAEEVAALAVLEFLPAVPFALGDQHRRLEHVGQLVAGGVAHQIVEHIQRVQRYPAPEQPLEQVVKHVHAQHVLEHGHYQGSHALLLGLPRDVLQQVGEIVVDLHLEHGEHFHQRVLTIKYYGQLTDGTVCQHAAGEGVGVGQRHLGRDHRIVVQLIIITGTHYGLADEVVDDVEGDEQRILGLAVQRLIHGVVAPAVDQEVAAVPEAVSSDSRHAGVPHGPHHGRRPHVGPGLEQGYEVRHG